MVKCFLYANNKRHLFKYIFFAISSFPIIEKKDQGQTAPLPFFFGFQGQPKIWSQFNKESLCAHYKYSDELSKIDAKNNGLKLILLDFFNNILGLPLWPGLPPSGGFCTTVWFMWLQKYSDKLSPKDVKNNGLELILIENYYYSCRGWGSIYGLANFIFVALTVTFEFSDQTVYIR